MEWGTMLFGNTDLLKEYGIVMGTPRDCLMPALRERKVEIPNRDGKYDYGANTYEERIVEVRATSSRDLTRQELRELAYILSKKSRFCFWDEPEKYYIGRIYDATALERVTVARASVVLSFTCEPFAYGATVTQPIAAGLNRIEYKGTARTPTLIVLKNNSKTTAQNVRITAIFRRKTL